MFLLDKNRLRIHGSFIYVVESRLYEWLDFDVSLNE